MQCKEQARAINERNFPVVGEIFLATKRLIEKAVNCFLFWLTLNVSGMLGDFIAGSPREINYSERFKIVF